MESLVWSADPRVGPFLRDFALQRVAVMRRGRRRRSALAPPRPSIPPDFPYRSLLRALRACPGKPTEDFLLTAAQDWDPTYRAAALSSLGWWEPMQRKPVLRTLQEARRDANPDVRHAARAALARLGERLALQWFRQTLTSEDPHRIHEAIQAVAVEGLTLLWPDLDHLADAEDEDVAQLARRRWNACARKWTSAVGSENRFTAENAESAERRQKNVSSCLLSALSAFSAVKTGCTPCVSLQDRPERPPIARIRGRVARAERDTSFGMRGEL